MTGIEPLLAQVSADIVELTAEVAELKRLMAEFLKLNRLDEVEE